MKKQNLLQIAEGFKMIAKAYEAEANGAVEVDAEVAVVKNEKPAKQNTKVEEVSSDEEGYSLDELNAMKVAELKSIADELELEYDAKIKKSDLIDLIMDGAEEEEEATEEDEEDVEEETDSDEEELTAEDLEEMSLAELKELAEEYEIKVPAKVKKPKLIEILTEELFSDEEVEEEEEEEEGDEEELTPEDLEEMSLSELKELADEYEVSYTKTIKVKALREKLIEELFAEEDEEEADDMDEADVAEELGLNDMELDELAELLTDHGLSAKGKKQALIARIVKAVEDGTIEIEEEEGE